MTRRPRPARRPRATSVAAVAPPSVRCNLRSSACPPHHPMAARDAVPDADASSAAQSASLCPSSTAAPFVYAPYTSAESDIVPSYWVQRYEDEAARYRSMVKVPAWWLWAARQSQEEASPVSSQPLPRLLKRATSEVADLAAFDHPGTGTSSTLATPTASSRTGTTSGRNGLSSSRRTRTAATTATAAATTKMRPTTARPTSVPR